MITDNQFKEWAQSSTKNPVLLVEITHKDGTVYLSDQFYATSDGETPEHISYDVCLKESVIIERTLDADSLGAVRVYNDGSLDHWLDCLFTGYDIEVFVGDKSWPRADFKRQYKGIVESFDLISATTFEIKSTLAAAVIETNIYNVNDLFIAGEPAQGIPIYIGMSTQYGIYGTGKRLYRIAPDSKIDRSSVRVFNDGYEMGVGIYDPPVWVDTGSGNSDFYNPDFPTSALNLTFRCTAVEKNLKSMFATICNEYGQAFNADNLAAYPFDPDIAFYANQSMTFPEFLNLTLETLGALLWINDQDEIEFYRKEIPDDISTNTVTSFITPNDNPTIQAITTEDPVGGLVVSNSPYGHLAGSSTFYQYNPVDLDFPYRTLSMTSYAENSVAIVEARRLADLLSVTRRTYSASVERITPELFIGAIVNIYSPKDRWNSGSEGLNALVVGFTQSFKSNKSELIVWR
jgi:hypothetical protein